MSIDARRQAPVLLFLGVVALSIGCLTSVAEGYVWEEYEQTRQEISEMWTLWREKNREVVAQYGAADTPEALSVLAPIRERLKAAQDRERHLLCWDRPDIPGVREMFESMGLRVHPRRVDRVQVDAFVSAKVSDGTLTGQEAERLRFTLSKAGQDVMNPSSRGAGLINQRIAKALRCYGLDSARADSTPTPTDTRKQSSTQTPARLRYYRTCGDPVCQDDGYRGPFEDVPVCQEQHAGAACVNEDERCDLANSCNMFLVCAQEDPATLCAR